MNIYKRILAFFRPYISHVVISLLLTFIYVMLNNVSLWVSVDFIGELFPTGQSAPEESVSPISELMDRALPADAAEGFEVTGQRKKAEPQAKMNVYRTIKRAVKSVLIREDQLETLRLVCAVIFITFFLKNIFDYLRRVINRFIQTRIVVDLRNQIQAAAMRLPLVFFDSAHTSRITSIVFNDVKSVRQVLSNSLGKIILTPLQMITNIVILVIISWKLSLITFIVIPLSGFIIIKIGHSMRRKSRRVLKQISEVMMLFQEAVSSIRVVKSFTSEEWEIRRFQRANRNFQRKQMRAHYLGQLTSPLNEVTAVSILIILLWIGGNLVYKGELQGEDFIRFLIFLFASLSPLRELSGLNNILQDGVAAAERIFGIIDLPHENYEPPGAVELKSFRESIRLEKVTFDYGDETLPVLKNINLEIKKSETVAFVGHSGSGKTTLVNLIPRFYPVQKGRITIDGVDIKEVTLKSLRGMISVVSQETLLFNDTIRNNIAYGLDNVSDEAVIEAAKAANAWEFIESMDGRLDAMVGERGGNFSGGQRQRLSIARAILKNPPILILDEATSALDTESEKLVQEAINSVMKNRTVLVIAHRLSTIIHAGKIVVLKQGEIVGVGNHRELLDACPLYRVLYEMQFQENY
ncbi:MAG TPA: ABC transporter ATP-binding protein [bacterium]|nr:ABC transporter ATP-binding protein [bacterium]